MLRAVTMSLVTLLAAGWMNSAAAQNNNLLGFTEKEKVGFAFYQLTQSEPPYDQWIYASAAYKNAKPNVQLDIVDSERVRLRQGFASFSPDRDLITITMPVKVTGGENPDFAANPEMQKAGVSQMININFMGKDDTLYLPFQLGQLWISVVPEPLEQRNTYFLTEDQYKNFCPNRSVLCKRFERNMDAQIILRAQSADATTPLVMHDVPLWLMMAELGAIMFMDRDTGLIWEYSRPWYKQDRATSLMTLFGQ